MATSSATCGASTSTTPTPRIWTVDLLARLRDLDSGLPQPVTTAPQIEIDINNGIDRYVFIGTGQLLDTSDFTTTAQRQTFYAIRDGTLAAPLTTGLPINPRVSMKAVNTDKVSSIVGGAPNGWYDDLPLTPTAERIVVDVAGGREHRRVRRHAGAERPVRDLAAGRRCMHATSRRPSRCCCRRVDA